jgi:tripartite-type tricarboxylate transporter receptor subunit TctC
LFVSGSESNTIHLNDNRGNMKKSMKFKLGRSLMGLAAVSAMALSACSSSDSTTDTAVDTTIEPDFALSGGVEWIIPYKTGGGFDAYSRGMSDALSKSGAITEEVTPINIDPFVKGVSTLFNREPNGQTVGILPMPAAAAQEIAYPDLAKWKTDQFTILGSIEENGYVVYVSSKSAYKSVADLQAGTGLRTITVEKGSSSSIANVVSSEALGLDFTITFGVGSSEEAVLALIRGDVDYIVYGTSDLVGFVDSGDITPILFLGTPDQRPANLEWLATVPTASEAGYPDLEGVVTEMRLVVGPPGMTPKMVAFWETAVATTLASAELKAWSTEAERPLVPRSAAEAKELFAKTAAQMQVLIPQLIAKGLIS